MKEIQIKKRYFVFNCSGCNQSLEVPNELFGKVIICPLCNKKIIVPIQKPFATKAPVNDVKVNKKRKVSPYGIASFVLGVIALQICWIPFFGLLSIPLSVIGLIIGIVGLIISFSRREEGFAFPITGIIICILSSTIAIAILPIVVLYLMAI